MFFGYNEKPAFLDRYKDLKIKRERMSVCSRDKGTCRGTWVVKQPDGSTKLQYAYQTADEPVMFDDGIWKVKCTTEYNGHTVCWTEEEA